MGDELVAAEERFWRRHLVIGVAFSSAMVIAGVAYLLATPHGPHRRALLFVAAAAVPISVSPLLLLARAKHAADRQRLFATWSIAVLLLVLVGMHLDGGSNSPAVFLLFPVLMYAGLAYPAAAIGALSGGAVLGVIAVMLTDANPARGGDILLLGTLGAAGIMAVGAAVNRDLQQHLERKFLDQVTLEATHDALTGCLNRRALDTVVNVEVERARRYGRPLAALVLDVDSLKTVNDQGGHAAGDAVLRAVAGVLAGGTRGSDFVGRSGGDEFVVLLPETSVETATAMAERIRAEVRTSAPNAPSVSIGVTGLADDDSPAGLLARADAGLYDAKRAGRDRVGLVSPPTAT